MFKRNNSLQCKSKAQLSHGYTAWPVAESEFCARSNQTTAFSLPYLERDLRV